MMIGDCNIDVGDVKEGDDVDLHSLSATSETRMEMEMTSPQETGFQPEVRERI